MSFTPGKPSKFGWLPFAALGLGFWIAGRRVRVIILVGLACLALFVIGTQTDLNGWHLTGWSWLAIMGFIVDLCIYPMCLILDNRDRRAARIEADVQRAQYGMAVQQEAVNRMASSAYGDGLDLSHDVTPIVAEGKHVAPRFEYETDSGLIVRDHRAVDPDEL